MGLASAEPHPSGTETHTEDQITVRTPSAGESQKDSLVLCIYDAACSHLFLTCEGDAGESRHKRQCVPSSVLIRILK